MLLARGFHARAINGRGNMRVRMNMWPRGLVHKVRILKSLLCFAQPQWSSNVTDTRNRARGHAIAFSDRRLTRVRRRD